MLETLKKTKVKKIQALNKQLKNLEKKWKAKEIKTKDYRPEKTVLEEKLELDEISTRHWGIIPCSAKTGEGLISGIDWVTNDIASRIYMAN